MKVLSQAETRVRTPGVDAALEFGWPMPVEAFLKGNYLERGDIVLTQRKGDMISRVIGWFQKNHFSHAAMVFIVPHREPCYDDTFVIEAGTSGVDLTKLVEYVDELHEAVAIRRLSRPWFTPELGERVRGRMLANIKAGYDYGIVWRLAKRFWFGLRRTVAKQEKVLASYKRHGYKPPIAYICSGFVQLGYVEGVIEAIKAGKAPPEAIHDVIFNPEAHCWLPEDWSQFTPAELSDILDTYLDAMDTELEATVPRDFAKARTLEWRYVIRHGYVFKVSTYLEMKKALHGRAPFLVPGAKRGLLDVLGDARERATGRP